MPIHSRVSKPGTPASATVGRLGKAGSRLAPVVAMPDQPALLHGADHRRDAGEHHLDLTRQQILHGIAAAPVMHRHGLDAGHGVEQFAGQMRRRADAGGGVEQARLLLGERDELGKVLHAERRMHHQDVGGVGKRCDRGEVLAEPRLQGSWKASRWRDWPSSCSASCSRRAPSAPRSRSRPCRPPRCGSRPRPAGRDFAHLGADHPGDDVGRAAGRQSRRRNEWACSGNPIAPEPRRTRTRPLQARRPERSFAARLNRPGQFSRCDMSCSH